MPTKRMGPPPGASPPMRMTASWSGPNLPNTSLRRAIRAQWRAPLRSSRRRIAGAIRRRASKKGPSPAHRPSACSGVKALRNTSLAKAASRQAPLAFRSLDPFRALREPDCRRRDEKRPFPLRTKNCQHNPKQPLDRKSPIQLRIPLAPAASQANSVPRRNSLGSARSRARCMNPANSTGEAGRASPYCAAARAARRASPPERAAGFSSLERPSSLSRYCARWRLSVISAPKPASTVG